MNPSAAQEQNDRRCVPRFPMPVGRVTGTNGDTTLLNIGRRGMAIEAPAGGGFEPGESHYFTLSDLSHSVEVRARVRWSRPKPPERATLGEFKSRQIAGFAFEEILTSKPEGIWRNLEVGRQPLKTGDIRSSPKELTVKRDGSPITMVEPESGSTVAAPQISVVCRLVEPSAVTYVSVNGIEATVDGELARADLLLDRGRNRLLALVRHQDGTYRTCLLGSVHWRDDQ